MTPQERIEESHGLWELAVSRLAGMAGIIVAKIQSPPEAIELEWLRRAVNEEREAFSNWQRVSKECGA